MNVKRSIALAIRDPARPGMLLLVQRPADDDDLPNVWGLPAATLAPDETAAAAALRAGRDKLGVELEIGGVLNGGAKQRDAYRLEMQLIEACIVSGTPDTGGITSADVTPDGRAAVDATPAGTTRYQAWRWGPVADLEDAAAQGSLCSRLALEEIPSGTRVEMIRGRLDA